MKRGLSPDGVEHAAMVTSPGADGSCHDYAFLDMLAMEWLRPIGEVESFSHICDGRWPSQKAIVLIVFCAYVPLSMMCVVAIGEMSQIFEGGRRAVEPHAGMRYRGFTRVPQ